MNPNGPRSDPPGRRSARRYPALVKVVAVMVVVALVLATVLSVIIGSRRATPPTTQPGVVAATAVLHPGIWA